MQRALRAASTFGKFLEHFSLDPGAVELTESRKSVCSKEVYRRRAASCHGGLDFYTVRYSVSLNVGLGFSLWNIWDVCVEGVPSCLSSSVRI